MSYRAQLVASLLLRTKKKSFLNEQGLTQTYLNKITLLQRDSRGPILPYCLSEEAIFSGNALV